MNTESLSGLTNFSALFQRQSLRTLFGYAGGLLLCLMVLACFYDLRRDTRNMPYYYQGDTFFYHITTKALTESGWFQEIPQMGAPGTLDLREVPVSDHHLHFFLQKLLTLKTQYYLSILNNYFLLTFPLVMMCALFAFRQAGLSWMTGLAMSLLYTFLPYHIIRGQHHLFLSAYFPVPLFLIVLLWLLHGELTWAQRRSWRFAFALLVCLLVGSGGFYYAYFACFYLLLAAWMLWFRHRQAHQIWLPLGLLLLISLLVTAHLWPGIQYAWQYGTTAVVNRTSSDADVYGLRLAQILLPVRFHRLKALSELKADYNQRPLINENDDASLGFIGAAGFLLLLGYFLFDKVRSREPAPAEPSLWLHLSVLTLSGFLLAMIGGVGSLVSLFGLTQLRAYNRISVFLAFFCLLAVGLWLEKFHKFLSQRLPPSLWAKSAFALFLTGLVWCGLLDQVSPYFLPNYQAARREFESDYNFVSEIEPKVPRGAMIFQLPVMSFPENPKVQRVFDYDLARTFLHSTHLRWSYGTIKGREPDAWVRHTAALPLAEMVQALIWAGFSGITIDRFGYQDNAASYEAELSKLLGEIPINAPNGRQMFFDFTGYARRLRETTPPEQHKFLEDNARHPVLLLWQKGFHDQEGTPQDFWRWCQAKGRLQIINRSQQVREFVLEANFFSETDSRLEISGFINERLLINRFGTPYSKKITVPPGIHTIHFSSDARRILTLNDYRTLVFRVRNYQLKSVVY